MSILPILVLLGAGAYVASSSKKKSKTSSNGGRGASSKRCKAPMFNAKKVMARMAPGSILSPQETVEVAVAVTGRTDGPILALKQLHNCAIICEMLNSGLVSYDHLVESGSGLMLENDGISEDIRIFATHIAMSGDQEAEEFIASMQPFIASCLGSASTRCDLPPINISKMKGILPPGTKILTPEETLAFASSFTERTDIPIRALKVLHNCMICSTLAKGTTSREQMVSEGRGLMAEDNEVTNDVRVFATYLAKIGEDAPDALAQVKHLAGDCAI